MEFIRQWGLQARAFLAQMSPNTRVSIVMGVVILALFGWIVLQYASSQDMVALGAIAAEKQAPSLSRLEAAGITAESRAGRIYVAADRQFEALAVLSDGELLSADSSTAFDELIRNQSPWMSNAQNARAFLLAKRKFLSQVVAKMRGVRSADVMLDMPEERGFGQHHVRPSASVNVIMQGDRAVDGRLVEAIAGLVSGAVAEMRPEDVEVIDANRGRRMTVKDSEQAAPSDAFELVQVLEREYEKKILDVLSYIHGVRVAVSVRTDPVQRKEIEQIKYEESEPLRSQESREKELRTVADAGEPGVRPNAGASIAGGRPTGTVETSSESRSEFGPKNITETSKIRERGQMTKQVNVTVNVPRSYFAQLLTQGQDDAAQAPTLEQIEAVAGKELPRIESQVQPLVAAAEAGIVRAHMVPDFFSPLKGDGDSGGFVQWAQGPWVRPLGLIGLALVSVGLMFGMVRKSLRQPPVPSVEELAGLPPSLPSDDDLVGEVNEDEGSMPGVEINEDELRVRRIADQINDMIKNNPGEAAGILHRWVGRED